VEVQTFNGRTLGRIGFTIVPSADPHLGLVKRILL
jgi:hypothetical protein